MEIIPMLAAHWEAVKSIYEQGIATGDATFQTEAPGWEEWDRSHLGNPRLVITDQGEVLGWAALTAVSGRCVYAGVAEVSVYVASRARGRGLGRRLLAELVTQSEKQNLWTLQAGIFPENTASIKIHEACGFRLVGRREKIGKMGNAWRDTLLLERRSPVIGTANG
jgi:L-amino acid N-acyltransferase YncA